MKEEIPQLYALCGRGARSTLRVLRPGLAATEIAVSPLPGNPTGIWTIKRSYSDDFDAYIIVAFTNATLVGGPHLAFVSLQQPQHAQGAVIVALSVLHLSHRCYRLERQ